MHSREVREGDLRAALKVMARETFVVGGGYFVVEGDDAPSA